MVRVEDFLVRIRVALEAAGVPNMLTGSLASSLQGIPRATNDIDIDIVVAGDRAQLISLVRSSHPPRTF